MTRWWTWPVILIIYAIITYAFSLNAHSDDVSGPRKIIGSVVKPDETDVKKRIVEQFKYPGSFDDEAACQKLRGSKAFELAVADLRRQIGLTQGQGGLTIETACVPIDAAPVHP